MWKVRDEITGEILGFGKKSDAEVERDRRIEVHNSFWCGRRFIHEPVGAESRTEGRVIIIFKKV